MRKKPGTYGFPQTRTFIQLFCPSTKLFLEVDLVQDLHHVTAGTPNILCAFFPTVRKCY